MKKFLKKPKDSKVKGISAEKALRSFTKDKVVQEDLKMTRQAIEKDERSLFFKKEMEQEIIGVQKWLS